MRSMVFCTTCRFSEAEQYGPDGRTGGETLVGHMEALLAERQRKDIAIQRQACLWNCKRHCSVILGDNRRFTYFTGDHVPERAQAEAILEWFDMHGATETGEVPFRQWPNRIRGHFIARIPPVRP
jgi:predicted metal-binding protein